MPSSSFLSPLSIPPAITLPSPPPPPCSARSPAARLTCLPVPAPARVLRIAFHVKHGELMRVICWPRARLRVLRSSWYNLKPARCVARLQGYAPGVKKSSHRFSYSHLAPLFSRLALSIFFLFLRYLYPPQVSSRLYFCSSKSNRYRIFIISKLNTHGTGNIKYKLILTPEGLQELHYIVTF